MAKINDKPASAYAKPHTMSGKPVGNDLPDMSVESGNDYLNKINISVGNVTKGPFKEAKKEGLETRGNGAAERGRKAMGPMA